MAKDSESKNKIYIGIAASAGGLEASSALVKNLPSQANAIYIVAQHMSPTHKSLLTSLISRETDLPVVELNRTDTVPKVDTIYITPPNSDVLVKDGKLTLVDPSGHPATPKPSADRLFNSLADECGSSCVGIVLSGTGTDGSYGVQAIRESGGITIAQDTASAKYDGMPSAAVETGCIDLTLTPEQIGEHLTKILANPHNLDDLRRINTKNNRASELLQILLARTRIDFRDYKENTVNRRIHRRMVALGIEDYDAYVEYCRTSQSEVDALHRDLLISVTRFFRDPEQFNQLRGEIASMLRNRAPGQLRIWVAGCATGEEAYSVAILVAEALGGFEELERNRVQIFATDIDERALDIARAGVYPITAAHDIPPEYLETYFRVSSVGVEVVPELRAVTLFSKHNIFQDPPFINVDLITLRNVLIYFNQSLQERVLARAHYALAPHGLLFLGTSESIGAMEMHFEARSGADKVYEKRSVARIDQNVVHDVVTRSILGQRQPPSPMLSRDRNQTNDGEQLFDALARTVAPNGFVVTRQNNIVRVFGDVTPMLELNEQSSLSLSTRILKPALRHDASGLISIAFKKKSATEGRWHSMHGPGFNQVRIVCYPIIASTGEDHMLVALQTRMENEIQAPLETLSDKERTAYILQIETEMQSTRETLQQTVEELQTSNEELQSVNEELQSTNEELQATNEELETSNEELQSTNEELITVNEEMQVNAAELQTVSMELNAVLLASPFPVLVIDHALLVRRASASALKFFEISELPASGMHLSQCSLRPDFPSITSVAAQVFKERKEHTIRVENNETVSSVVFSPFNDSAGHLLGLTISILDYDILASAKMTEVMERMAGVGSWRYDGVSGKLHISKEVARQFDLPQDDSVISLDHAQSLLHPEDRDMAYHKISRAIEKGRPFHFEARAVRSPNRILHVQISGAPIVDENGVLLRVVGAFRDATNAISSSMILENLERLQMHSNTGIFSYDIENDKMFLTGDALALLDLAPEETDRSLQMIVSKFAKHDQADLRSNIVTLIENSGQFEKEYMLANQKAGTSKRIVQTMTRQRLDGSVSHLYGSIRRTANDAGKD